MSQNENIKITNLTMPELLAGKILMFTDIHFGKKNNSLLHNQDCINFIDFVIEQVKSDNSIKAIAFLGDWFENRNAINIMTLDYADNAADKLDALGLPIFFIIGNHDLYHRHSRSIYSPKPFKDKKNFILVDHFVIVNNSLLFSPFLFHAEYSQILGICDKLKYAFGHFEFKDFVLTGTNNKMEHGPEHTMLEKFTYVFSGHFHKRQIKDNVVFIGNSFPMDYGDAGDDARGVCILDIQDEMVRFKNWEQCPKYFKLDLSHLLESGWTPPEQARVICRKDIDMTFTEVQSLREEFISAFNLREFKIEEDRQELKDALGGEVQELKFDANNLNQAISDLIKTGVKRTTTIDPEKLCREYSAL